MSTLAPPTAEYCREIEAYLCRRNGGHLIRIVGPAFDTVAAWSRQGIPLKVVFKGIDRRVDRDRRPGARQRPVRIEFCEADIFDAFDEWRRAVGAVMGSVPEEIAPARLDDAERSGTEAGGGHRRRVALQAHIDRVMARLTQCRLDAGVRGALAEGIDVILRELDALRAQARGIRGEARAALVRRLMELDAGLIAAARAAASNDDRARHDDGARRDLQPFKDRMPAAAFEEAVAAASAARLRESLRLPELAVGL